MPNFEPLLQEAQHIINTYHKNESAFFSKCNFLIDFVQVTDESLGFVEGTFPNYKIGIHVLFDRLTNDDQRSIAMTIVHELLHIIHADWDENQIAVEEYRLANLSGYFDILQRRDTTYLKRVRSFRDLIQDKTTVSSKSPITILKERYAKGEITEEEFHKIKKIFNDEEEKERDELKKFKDNDELEISTVKREKELDKSRQKSEDEANTLIEKISERSLQTNEKRFANGVTTKYDDMCCVLACNVLDDTLNGKLCEVCNNFCCPEHLDNHACSNRLVNRD